MKALELRIQLALTQAAQSQARSQHYNTRIISGAYKTRISHWGGLNGPLLTQEELLESEVHTSDRHLENAEKHIEYAMGLIQQLEQESK